MPVHSDTGGRLEFFSIDGGEDSDIVIGSTGGSDKAVVFVDHLNKMADDERDSLDTFELFFGTELLSFEFDLVFFDVVLLNVEELEVLVELLEFVVEVLLLSFG